MAYKIINTDDSFMLVIRGAAYKKKRIDDQVIKMKAYSKIETIEWSINSKAGNLLIQSDKQFASLRGSGKSKLNTISQFSHKKEITINTTQFEKGDSYEVVITGSNIK